MTDIDSDITYYMAGVVPRDGVSVEEAIALLFNRGAITVIPGTNSIHTAALEATFARSVVLRCLVADGKVTACSVSTDSCVYLAGTLEAAVHYVLNHPEEPIHDPDAIFRLTD